ncbi:MAG: hypothetical protein U9N34_09560, partial [Candidatus Cloacimonadota bacterium]|nr:hypothetical protein [Candidatus Cloacimonadota bacterium]
NKKKKRSNFLLTNPLFPQINWEIFDLLRAGIFFCFFLSLLLFLEKIFLPPSFFNSFDSSLFLALSNTILVEVVVFLFVFNFLIKKYSLRKDCFANLFSSGKRKAGKIALGIRSYFYLLPILFFIGVLTGLLVKFFGYSLPERTFTVFLTHFLRRKKKEPALVYLSF